MIKPKSGKAVLLTGTDKNFRAAAAQELASQDSSEFDTAVIDTLDNQGIDAVREITKLVSRKPYQSELTSIIILEAHKLTSEAQNALLKILEEPVDDSQLILTAPSRDLLLPTVASRLSETNLVLPKKGLTKKTIDLNLAEQSLSDQLSFIEKTSREDYLDLWSNKLKKSIFKNNPSLKSTHRYSKLIIKMIKAEKGLVNKKLIDLILALEIP